MIRIIAFKEYISTLRDARFLTIGTLVLVLLLTATLVGFQQYKVQDEERTRAQELTREEWLGQDRKHPHLAAHFGTFAFVPKSSLSFLDFGVSTYLGSSISLEAHRQNEARFTQAQDATSLLRFGEMTVAFVLQLLIPLLIIFLCFASFTQEREEGTLKVLLSQGASIRQLAWGKIFGFSLVTATVVVPALALAAVLLFTRTGFRVDNDAIVRMGLLFGFYLLYFFIFIVLSVWVSARSHLSRTSLLKLLAAWVFICIIVPKAASNIGNNLYPTPSKYDFSAALQRDVENGIDGHNPQDIRSKALKQELMDRYGVDSLNQLPVNFEGFWMQAGEEYTSQVYSKHFGDLQAVFQQQDRISELASLINPFLAIRAISMGLSGTDYAQFVDFKEGAEKHRFLLNKEMNLYLANNSRSTGWDDNFLAPTSLWKTIPDFKYQPPTVGWVLGNYVTAIASLLLWLLLALAMIWFGIKKVQAV